jgi:iron(III) transport system ATP-binding protein
VDHVGLELVDGEFVSLLGPSGCGKTTMLRMVAGFMVPTEGQIVMDGKLLSDPSYVVPPERRSMSMIFQSYAIWPNMTVGENVAFGLQLRKLPREEVRARVKRILEVVRLGHLIDRYPAELSGGQQQRVALARAIVIEPKVLLLDEPLSNLDATLREELRYEIRRLHDEFRITSIYVTHDQAEAMVTSDRIVVMNQGRIEQVDTPVQLYMQPLTRFVASFIGQTNLIDGYAEGREFRFDGFSIPAGLLPGSPVAHGSIALSIRPHGIRLDRDTAAAGPLSFNGTIIGSAYLGDSWTYQIVPSGSATGTPMRVNTAPYDRFELGETVSLAIDPRAVAVVTR